VRNTNLESALHALFSSFSLLSVRYKFSSHHSVKRTVVLPTVKA